MGTPSCDDCWSKARGQSDPIAAYRALLAEHADNQPVLDVDGVRVHQGDSLALLRTMPDNSVHAVVTDPPYGLADHKPAAVISALTAWANGDRERVPDGVGFMGRSWDAFVPPPAVWDECLRVLKPGGHLLVFAGTRTVDLMGLSIRLAGFELRDSVGYGSALIAWCYGSGFPKSLNVNKDKRFCQCLPGVRDAATDDAAESAAQILLSEMHGGSSEDPSDLTGLHGLPVAIHSDHEVSGGQEQDVLGDLCPPVSVVHEEGPSVESGPASGGRVRAVRHDGAALTEQGAQERGDLLLDELSGTGAHSDAAGECLRRDGQARSAAVRRGESCLEGRGDVQAGEGQLHRPALRPMPGRSVGDGPLGRVHSGAQTGDVTLDRPPSNADRVRESCEPQSARQPARESGPLAHERGSQAWRGWPLCPRCSKPRLAPGLGTALKPAWEPIIVARKPLAERTVATNVLAHGCGGLNVDACRVRPAGQQDEDAYRAKCASVVGLDSNRNGAAYGEWTGRREDSASDQGRWPANVVLDEHMAVELDAQSGISTSSDRPRQNTAAAHNRTSSMGKSSADWTTGGHADTGGASRFFPVFKYQAKAPSKERPKVDGKGWPTVKPLELMRWLVRLVTPPDGGVVLDPFAGSGTTGQAAALEGFGCVLIERDQLAIDLIRKRLTGCDPEPVGEAS